MLCVHFLLLPSEVSPGACSGCIFNMFFHAVVKKKKLTKVPKAYLGSVLCKF